MAANKRKRNVEVEWPAATPLDLVRQDDLRAIRCLLARFLARDHDKGAIDTLDQLDNAVKGLGVVVHNASKLAELSDPSLDVVKLAMSCAAKLVFYRVENIHILAQELVERLEQVREDAKVLSVSADTLTAHMPSMLFLSFANGPTNAIFAVFANGRAWLLFFNNTNV